MNTSAFRQHPVVSCVLTAVLFCSVSCATYTDYEAFVRMGRTPKTLIEQAIRTLGSYNVPVAGMIATDQKPRSKRYHYYRYGYRYNYRYYNSYRNSA